MSKCIECNKVFSFKLGPDRLCGDCMDGNSEQVPTICELKLKVESLTEIVKGLLVDCKTYDCKDNCGHYIAKGNCIGVSGIGKCGKVTRVEIAEEIVNG